MRTAVFSLIGCLLVSAASAQGQVDCGSPPLVEDSDLQGRLDGSARFLSGFFGNAALGGQIELKRSDIFKQVPDGLKAARADAYLQYQVCSFLARDQTLSTKEKIDELIRVRQSFFQSVAH